MSSGQNVCHSALQSSSPGTRKFVVPVPLAGTKLLSINMTALGLPQTSSICSAFTGPLTRVEKMFITDEHLITLVEKYSATIVRLYIKEAYGDVLNDSPSLNVYDMPVKVVTLEDGAHYREFNEGHALMVPRYTITKVAVPTAFNPLEV